MTIFLLRENIQSCWLGVKNIASGAVEEFATDGSSFGAMVSVFIY